MTDRTFFQQEIFERDGKKFRRFQTGPLKSDPNYRVHSDGSVRHAHAQFKGNKKDRRRFVRAVRAALTAPIPEDYAELKPDDKLQPEDQLFNVATSEWEATPYIDCSLRDLQTQFIIFVRACRST